MNFLLQTLKFSSVSYILLFYFILFYCALHFNVVKSSDVFSSERFKRQDSDYNYDYESRCTIPTSFLDKTATFECSKRARNQSCILNGGTEVLEYTTVTFSCKPGYHLVKNKTPKWICLERSWSPKLPQCTKVCDKLTPENAKLTCYRNSAPIDCNSPLLPGDRVVPVCDRLHTFKHKELVCQINSSWNHNLSSCTPECGRPFKNTVPLIANGRKERLGDAPWHVAIYNKKKVLICGGTIISPRIVLTAAHCFVDYESGTSPASDYEIIVGKLTRNYTVIDSAYQKTYKVTKLYSDNYLGFEGNHAHDIGLLILDGNIEVSATVMPACVHWRRRQSDFTLDDLLGKISGWGLDEKEALPETLLTADLPYITKEQCRKAVSKGFRPFITDDKFCAGSRSGAIASAGDSGSGFLFNEEGFYYIEGIVSTKPPTNISVMACTDVADHIDWISKVRNEVESEK